MNIKVLGPGCPNCKRLSERVSEALAELRMEAMIEKVTAYPEMMKYDILGTPGLVIDGKVVSSGRIPSKDEVKDWLQAAQNA